MECVIGLEATASYKRVFGLVGGQWCDHVWHICVELSMAISIAEHAIFATVLILLCPNMDNIDNQARLNWLPMGKYGWTSLILSHYRLPD